MPGQKLLRAHASAPFALKREDPEGLLSALDDDAPSVRFQDLAWRTGTSIDNFHLPDFEQLRLGLRGQEGVGARPGDQGANAVPQAARGLGPVQAPVFLGNLAGVARP